MKTKFNPFTNQPDYTGDGITNALAVRDTYRNLAASRPSVTTVNVTADELILQNSSGLVYRASGVNVTPDITASGANGLDTGSEANSTWYHSWVIYNGTTVAGLLSTSATNPTMPSGYTFKAYGQPVYNDSGGDFDDFSRVNSFVTILLTTIGTGLTDDTYTSRSLASIVPNTAKKIIGNISPASSTTETGNHYIASTSSGLYAKIYRIEATNSGATSMSSYQEFSAVLVESQTIYSKRGTATGQHSLFCSGYEL